MEHNAALRVCPGCGTRHPRFWRRLLGWRWPLPLAVGLALQLLSQRVGPEGGAADPLASIRLASISRFIAGVVVFAGLAALLLFVGTWVWAELRGRSGRRRRRQARRQS